MNDSINIVRIRTVANTLKELNESVVFVGGATVSLYVNQSAPEARPTDDIDVIIELASYRGYALLEERLRAVGFTNDVESGIICRFKIHGLTVDIMPTDTKALGFTNKWYSEGFKNAIPFVLDERTTIYIFSLPFFLASKLEAFKNRGKNEFRFSSDFEDIIYVLENADNVLSQLLKAPPGVQSYLRKEFTSLMKHPTFEEGIIGHLSSNSSQVFERVMDILQNFLKVN